MNRQIYDEAHPIFVQNHEFVYMGEYKSYEMGPKGLLEKIPRVHQKRSIFCSGTLKEATRIRAEFGYNNNMMTEFFKLLCNNKNLASLHILFSGLTYHYVALPLLEQVKVKDKVVLDFKISKRPPVTKRQKEVIKTLKVLEKKMLEK